MPSQPHIVVVEDDAEIGALIKRYLRSQNFQVSVAGDGAEMDALLAKTRADLIVLDLMLPGEDGLSICRRVRATSDVPIIILTARGEDIDRIIGLEMGADDYLGKPFNPRELLARIKAVLRRGSAGPVTQHRTKLAFAGWQLDCTVRQLRDPTGAQSRDHGCRI